MTEDVHQWTGAYALDAVTSDERAFIERHLSACASCRAEVEQLRETAARLGALVEEDPPERMRAAVLDAIARTPQEEPADGAERVTRNRFQRRLPAVAAMLATVVITLAASVAYLVVDRAGEPSLFEVAREAEVVALSGAEDERGTVLSLRDEAILIVAGLEPVSEEETYQAWVIRNDQPQSAGIFSTEADGTGILRLEHAVDTADAIAVTREKAGGAEGAPQGPIVLSGPVQTSGSM